ncbi:hypothetical protein D3C72_2278120 [compost metagenome]
MDYVHINPLKHGHVTQVADWPYSTFHRYVASGIYPQDWCGEVDRGWKDWSKRPKDCSFANDDENADYASLIEPTAR